jgi:hypothetical protein
MRLTLGIAALAATFVAASPAAAQSLYSDGASAQARGIVLTAQSLVRVRDLDFGTVTVDPTSNGGTVTITAEETADRTTSDADVTELGSVYQSAHFSGIGAEGQLLTLTLGQPGVLIGPDNAEIEATLTMNQDTSVTPITLPAGGRFNVYVGGTFTIDADQPAGLYAANFNLTADFN